MLFIASLFFICDGELIGLWFWTIDWRRQTVRMSSWRLFTDKILIIVLKINVRSQTISFLQTKKNCNFFMIMGLPA